MPKNTDYTSRYADTPESTKYFKFLDIWVPTSILVSANDYAYVIENKYDENPGLLAFDLYGDTRLYWVFVLRNIDLIIDPIGDFKAGLQIMIPNKRTVDSLT